jgi:hypothetical protein
MEHEVLEEPELPWGEIDQCGPPANLPLEPVHLEIFEAQNAGRAGPPAAGERVHPGYQLVEIERLGEVVVGAGVEPAHDIRSGIAPGEHEDRGLHALPPQLRSQLEPVTLGKLDIEQDQIVRVEVAQIGALVSVGRDVHRVAFLLESLLQEPSRLGIVFHDQDSHNRSSPGSPAQQERNSTLNEVQIGASASRNLNRALTER